MRADASPPRSAARDPDAAEERHDRGDDARGERRERPRPDLDRHLRRREREQACEHHRTAGARHDDPYPGRHRRVGERQPRGPALGEIEQRQPKRGDRVDRRPGHEREPVVREAVEVQRRRRGGHPDEDDDGGEPCRDALPRVREQHADEVVAAGDIGRAEDHRRDVDVDRPGEQLAGPIGQEEQELRGVGEKQNDARREPARRPADATARDGRRT
jgi:hypothetical protein